MKLLQVTEPIQIDNTITHIDIWAFDNDREKEEYIELFCNHCNSINEILDKEFEYHNNGIDRYYSLCGNMIVVEHSIEY